MKGDKIAKKSSIGSIMRKRLSDITNALPQIKAPVIKGDNSFYLDSASEENAEQLLRENMALVKLIEDRNKIIELNGLELQKVRITLQKLQLQNWNLAQVNSHMTAELNLGREKVKCIQQELMCKEALLKAMPKILQEKGTLNGDIVKDEDVVMREPGPNNGSRKQRPIRSQSMGNSSTSQKIIEQTATENKRRCLRRKSASCRVQHQEPSSEDLFEIEDVKFTSVISYDTPTHVNGPTPLRSSITNGVKDVKQSGSTERRASLGRPSRRAAGKVQSYKEIPLNIKMRRIE